MNRLRIVVVGGALSYRALFDWLTPGVLIPALLVTPLAQILLFAYLGRSAGVASDQFFLVGNAIQYSAVPCLFGMTSTIVGERLQGTLSIVFASPAPRLALLLGRSLPVLVNGVGVSLFGLFAGGLILGAAPRPATVGPVVVAVLASGIGCVGLGLLNAAIGLRLRDTAVLSTLLYGVLLVLSGAALPPGALPAWASALGRWVPLTHGIEAARMLTDGAGMAGALRPLATEVALGVAYGLVGAFALRRLERHSRRAASMELA